MSREVRRLLVATGAILLLRGALLGVPALTDPTESRYATIAAQMAESGDWVTPRLWLKGELVPYWGKPPLHFWLTAASFKAFGVSTWAARTPSFLTGLVTIALTGWVATRIWGALAGATAALILATAGFFYPCLGASIIDMTLTMGVAGALIAFMAAVKLRSRGWGLMVFVFLALGFMTKGPVALVLAGFPVVLWLALSQRWRDPARLPWVAGVILFLVLTVPWFVAAERATPGFLRYFFVNENFLRFIRHDYGDLYGAGHSYPYGTIWLALIACFLPWTFPLTTRLWTAVRSGALRTDLWAAYAVCWGFAPALLFTFGRQWLPAYLLPGFPGLAIATAVLPAAAAPHRASRGFPAALRIALGVTGVYLAALVALAVGTALLDVLSDRASTRTVVDRIADDPASRTAEIRFYRFVPHSAMFYGKTGGLRVSPVPVEDGGLAQARKDPCLLIVRRRRRILPPAALRGAHEVVRTTEWVAYRW